MCSHCLLVQCSVSTDKSFPTPAENYATAFPSAPFISHPALTGSTGRVAWGPQLGWCHTATCAAQRLVMARSSSGSECGVAGVALLRSNAVTTSHHYSHFQPALVFSTAVSSSQCPAMTSFSRRSNVMGGVGLPKLTKCVWTRFVTVDVDR